MPFSDPALIIKLLRRHVHDVRNHCSGLDLDASLLAEISDDPETVALAARLKNQVSRIESDLKAILLKVDDSRPIAVTTGDLLQIWKLRVSKLAGAEDLIEWPGSSGSTPVFLDSRLVVQVLTELTIKACSRNRGVAVRIVVDASPEGVSFQLCEPINTILPFDYLEETAMLLSSKDAKLSWSQDPDSKEWITALSVSRPPTDHSVL